MLILVFPNPHLSIYTPNYNNITFMAKIPEKTTFNSLQMSGVFASTLIRENKK